MTSYIFDVDGTLTPSRAIMDWEFKKWFEHFATHNAVYLVTGSDRSKTMEQIGDQIYNLAIRVYQCSGNDVWEQSTNIRSGKMVLPLEMEKALDAEITNSKFLKALRNGKHLEIRNGSANLSIPGHGCSLETRYHFRQFDDSSGERYSIAERLGKQFPHYKFQVAGETGIDIIVKGADKSQILKDFDSDGEIFFFGDKTAEGGNDYEIAQAVLNRPWGRVISVNSWEDTWNSLKSLE